MLIEHWADSQAPLHIEESQRESYSTKYQDRFIAVNNNPEHQIDALILMDMQRNFIDTYEAKIAAKKIQRYVALFRQAGLPIYAVYTKDHKTPVERIDFSHYTPEPEDTLIHKSVNSAFENSGDDFKAILTKNNHHNPLFMGFNAYFCVMESLLGAQEQGFHSWLALDGIGSGDTWGRSGSKSLNKMFNAQAKIITTSGALNIAQRSNSNNNDLKAKYVYSIQRP
jgi:nicotinamidase-related amidase